MTTASTLTILILLGIGVCIWLLGSRLQKRERRAFSNREILSDSEIYQRFYKSTQFNELAVLEIWHEISSALQLEPGILRPTDVFGKTFAKNWLTSGGIDVLELEAAKRIKKMSCPFDLSKIRTVDDYVRAFAGHS